MSLPRMTRSANGRRNARQGDGYRFAPPILRNSCDRLQPRLDRGPSRFEERRQRQFFAQRFHRLVGRKARTVGGDLEQDAVGLAEIEAAEIEAVDLAAVGDAQFVQPLRPGVILRLVGGAERDVVDAAGALPCDGRILVFEHMQLGGGAALSPASPIANTWISAPCAA